MKPSKYLLHIPPLSLNNNTVGKQRLNLYLILLELLNSSIILKNYMSQPNYLI
jgi:hypothetical protein